MSNTKNILSGVFFLFTFLAHGQGNAYKKADKYFDQFLYAAAAEAYEKIVHADSSSLKAMERLAICYDKLNDPQRAEKWLSKICKDTLADAEDIKLFAQVLAENEKYSASAEWYQKYLSRISDTYASNTISSYGKMEAFYSDSSFYTLKAFEGNSSASDFSPAFYKDGILFCSARIADKKSSTYGWDNSAFIDLYFANEGSTSVANFGKPVNSALHEGPASFSVNENTLYFTRNNFIANRKNTSKEGVVKLKIYYTTLKDGEWQKEEEFSLNSDEYSTGHPAIANDGKLFFVSDRPGGFGGTDIYYTTRLRGRWSAPVNLGDLINTPGNEMFPFVAENGDLYFASNTQAGLGGLDIFYSKFESEKFLAPKNLGYPVNTSRDDFGLIVKEGHGFFSSNRGNNPKDDNIYEIIIDKTRSLNIAAVDEKGSVLSDFHLTISEDKTISEKQVSTVFSAKFDCEKMYVLECSRDGYDKKTLMLTADQLKKYRQGETITITLIESIRTITLDLQSADGKRLTDGHIEVRDLSTGEKSKVTIGENGLMAASLRTGSAYEIIGSRKDYRIKTVNIPGNQIANMKTDETIVISLLPSSVLFEKNEIGQEIELEIRYDVNKATIRPDAARELDKLVLFLSKNVNVKVELGSHTDSRGSNEANLKLSQKRAESAVRYLTGKGISAKRLLPMGYGEDDLKVPGATTEQEHKHNRRTTVKIVGL
jgi:outer membrane protein OmpA-like peptidoglycan-associated protein/tetratricopeptide (TPR) repeat protein